MPLSGRVTARACVTVYSHVSVCECVYMSVPESMCVRECVCVCVYKIFPRRGPCAPHRGLSGAPLPSCVSAQLHWTPPPSSSPTVWA